MALKVKARTYRTGYLYSYHNVHFYNQTLEVRVSQQILGRTTSDSDYSSLSPGRHERCNKMK